MNRIEQIEKRLAEATQGPWKLYSAPLRAGMHCILEIQTRLGKTIVHWAGFDSCDLPNKRKVANADLIANAPDDLRYLLDENARMRDVLTKIAGMMDANDTESYRADDSEGAMDSVFAMATAILEGSKP